MSELSNLPPEIIGKILDDSTLDEILNISRTSKYLRSVVISTNQIWLRANDAHLLPIPMGKTLQNLAPSLIPLLAARVVSISALYNQDVVEPIASELIYPLGDSHLEKIEDSWIFPIVHILPGSLWIVLGVSQSTVILNIRTREMQDLPIGESLYGCASAELANSSEIVLATFSGEFGNEETRSSTLDVFVLKFSQKERDMVLTRVEKRWSLEMPPCNSSVMAINNSYIAVPSTERRIFIINWREKTGCSVAPYKDDEKDEFPPADWISPYFSLTFHSTDPLLVISILRNVDEPEPHTFELLDLPKDMSKLSESLSSIQHIPTAILYSFDEESECGNMTYSVDEPILKLLTVAPRGLESRHPHPSILIDNAVLSIHHRFHPSGWRSQRPYLTLPGARGDRTSMRIVPDLILEGKQLFICNTRSSTLDPPKWTELQMNFSDNDYDFYGRRTRVLPIAFDPVHGKLFVFRQGIWLIEY